MRRNFAKRDLKEFNKFRAIFQWLFCSVILGSYLKLFYSVKFSGNNKIDKNTKFIVACNHISNWDPFIVAGAIHKHSLAFMAKQELFEKFFSRLVMNWCGAFSVNRDKVEVSTLKTALSIKNTKWNLGIFPQGTRQEFGKFGSINKGFATLAKTMKIGILPVAIIGSDKKAKFPLPFVNKNKITVKFGDIIPYSNNIDEMIEEWKKAIIKLTEGVYSYV